MPPMVPLIPEIDLIKVTIINMKDKNNNYILYPYSKTLNVYL